jgi:prepilin-type N-terminal cleavage/methylation domain-containing protein
MAATSRSYAGRRHRLGITLVELLIALFVFSIVAVLASSGIVQALRVQSLNEANASLQGKLRRVTEVISQDLRSTVLGAVVDAPFASGSDQISFTIAVGGQGYEVRQVGGNPWPASVFRVFTDQQPVAAGDRILVVNGSGLGATVPVGGVVDQGNGRFDVSLGGGCTTSVGFSHPARMFVVDAVGYRLLDNGDLQRQATGEAAQALAFALSTFEVQYAYRHQDGSIELRDAPRTDSDGTPLRVDVDPSAGIDAVLESVRVRMSAEQNISGDRTVERTYASQIALPPPGNVNLRSVVSCP